MFTVYTPDGEAVGFIENVIAAEWERKMYGAGKFDIEVPATPEMLALLKHDRIVVNNGEAGIIECVKFEREDDAPILTVSGCELDGVIKRRLMMQEEALDGVKERLVLEMIDVNCCQGDDRQIAKLHVPVSKGRGEDMAIDDAFKKRLDKVVEDTLEGGDLGIRVKWPSWEVEIFEGVDRSAAQAENPRVILSVEGETLLSLEFEDDRSDASNYVIVEASSPGGSFTRYYGDTKGLDRREYLVGAGSVEPVVTITYPPKEQGGGKIVETSYGKGADEVGRRELANRKEDASLTGVVARNLIYRKDYDLGDEITIESQELGISQDVRITEIVETYSEQGLEEVELVFGKKSSIKQLIRRIDG